jgi:hypothetical protein
MDVAFLALGAVLVASTAGLIFVCDRLHTKRSRP